MGRRILSAEQRAHRREMQRESQRKYRAAHPEKYEAAIHRGEIARIAKGPLSEEEKAKDAVQSRATYAKRRARGEKPWLNKMLSAETKTKKAARDKARAFAYSLEGRTRVLTQEQKARRALRDAARVKKAAARCYAVQVPLGSVLACAAPSEARDLLAQITQAVPRYDDHDEVVAGACLLALSGASVEKAVREARKIVQRSAASLACAKSLHDCF